MESPGLRNDPGSVGTGIPKEEEETVKIAELPITLSPIERLKRKVALLTAENRRMARLLTNEKLVARLEQITCPVCYRKIAADRTYATPYRHILSHLIEGE